MKKVITLSLMLFAIIVASNSNAQNFVKVSKINAGKVIKLATDQVLEISLPCIPSSGYGWYEPTSTETKKIKVVEQSGDWDFIPYKYEIGFVGEPGDQIIRYVGSSKGTTNLTLEYKRPWEKDKSAVESYTITIESAGKYSGSYTPPVKAQATQRTINPNPTLLTATLPSKFTWQYQCTPIKDQGQCGSCWAFAGCGTFEADIKIVDGDNANLSEQYLVNCDGGTNDGCQGGNCPHSYWVSPGCVYEPDCPYVDYSCNLCSSCGSATCINTCGTYPHHEKALNYADVAGENSKGIPPDSAIKRAIYNYGPVWVAIDAGNNFQNYTSGIFTTSDGTTTDHAVVLVGWVDSSACTNGGYWILRNSWNTTWGDNGWMKIAYDISAVGTKADYLIYKGLMPHAAAPVAHFAAFATNSCTGVVQFTDSSTNIPTSWHWHFGDGDTSIVQNPSHTYTASGTYTVTLKATNSNGNNTLTKNSYVTVNLNPTAPTAPNVSRCGAGTVTLVASGGTNSNYYWYDGSSNLLGTSASYTTSSLTTTTTYYVEDLSIGNNTSLNAATSPNTYCGTSGNYALLFNITNPSTANSIVVTGISAGHYHESTAYTTQVYYRNTTYVGHETSNTGWTQVYNGTSTSQVEIPVTNFTIPPGGVYGIYVYIASDGGFFETGAATYSNLDMTITTGSKVCSPTAAFTSGTLTAGYSMFGAVYYKTLSCISPLTACEAIINTPPTAAASSNSPACTGYPLTLTGNPTSMSNYVWSGPSSYTNTTESPTVSASATTAMAGTYTLTVTDANGCTGTNSTTVAVNTTPSISSFTPASRCGTGTVTLGAVASAGTISWYTTSSGGSSVGTGTSYLTPSLTTTTTYYVAATSGSCSTPTRTAVVATINTAPVATANSNGPVCAGTTLSLTGSPGSMSTYAWSGPSYTNSTQSPTVSNNATIAMSGTYYLTVTDANGCTGTNSTVVTVNPSPAASMANTNVSCNGGNNGTATVTASGGTPSYTYLWNTTPAQSTAIATGLSAGTFIVTVTDANSCTKTTNVSITQPATSLTASISSFLNVTCNGDNSGNATVSSSGGIPTYTYSWNTTPVQTTATATGLIAGTYTVTVTDANSCTKTASVTITQPSNALVASISTQTDVNCYGDNSGSATVTASNGTPSYTYSWSTSPVQATNTASGLSAGTYVVTVTDANSCTKTTSVTINQPASALVAIISSQTNVTCDSNNSRSATVSPSGGTPSYSFSWNTTPVQTTANATGLSTGTYTVTVTDANSCTKTTNVTITQPTTLTANISSHLDESCFGYNNGSATVSVSSGTPSYYYLWNTTPAQTLANATGLSTGTYTVTVTDANNCTNTAVVLITQPTAIAASISVTSNVSCYGDNSGSTAVTASDGTPSYTYSWNTTPVQSTALASGLSAGTYTVTVTDANSCTKTADVTITQPANALSASISVTSNVSCYGDNSGSATVTASDGTPTYTYLWNTTPVQSTALASGLSAGTYTVTVTDANSCTNTADVTITQPANALSASISVTSNVSCYGDNSGSATVTASDGIPSYTYSWNTTPVQSTALASGLSAGTYTVTVTDANNCTNTAVVLITQPTAIAASISVTSNVSCYGDNSGSATVTASDGTPSYTYSWNTTPVQSTALASGLSAGTYTVTVTDANSCTKTADVTITQPANALSASISVTSNVSCYGDNSGSATVTASDGTPTYTYLWNTTPVQSTALASGLSAGTYTVTVTDANNCTNTAVVLITQPTAIAASISVTSNVSCYGDNSGSATVTASDGTPSYTYSWNTTPVQTSANATGLSAGTYTVTVTDANSCTKTTDVTITQPANALTVSISSQTDASCFGYNDGSTSVTASNGTPSYSYSWNTTPAQTSVTATGLSAGNYSVTVTDANGCSNTTNVTINQPTAVAVSVSASLDTICSGSSTTLTETSSANTCSWSGGLGTANPLTVAPTSTTTYTITCTDGNGCSGTANITIVVSICTGITALNSDNNFVIYPNPANDNLTIESSSINKDAVISIYNIEGQLLKQQQMLQTKTNIDISAFANGIYYIKINTEKGVAVKKFIKE